MTSDPQEDALEERECAICQEEMAQTKVVSLPCGHLFHKDCIREWLGRKATCPTCAPLLNLLPNSRLNGMASMLCRVSIIHLSPRAPFGCRCRLLLNDSVLGGQAGADVEQGLPAREGDENLPPANASGSESAVHSRQLPGS